MVTLPGVGSRVLQAYLNERLYNKRKAVFWLQCYCAVIHFKNSRCLDACIMQV